MHLDGDKTQVLKGLCQAAREIRTEADTQLVCSKLDGFKLTHANQLGSEDCALLIDAHRHLLNAPDSGVSYAAIEKFIYDKLRFIVNHHTQSCDPSNSECMGLELTRFLLVQLTEFFKQLIAKTSKTPFTPTLNYPLNPKDSALYNLFMWFQRNQNNSAYNGLAGYFYCYLKMINDTYANGLNNFFPNATNACSGTSSG